VPSGQIRTSSQFILHLRSHPCINHHT
jgi:hypothetical protein